MMICVCKPSQQTEPVQVMPVDLEARRKLFDGYTIHQQSLYDGTARAFAAHRIAAERAAFGKAIEICREYGCEAADELVTRIEQLTAPAAQSVKGFAGDPRDSE